MLYEQSTGNFYIDGTLIETGYAGNDGIHINNPDSQCIKNKGPLPRGKYRMKNGNNAVTVYSIRLVPFKGNDMCSPVRDNFLIHGGKISGVRTASDGCIILSRNTRIFILKLMTNRILTVTR